MAEELLPKKLRNLLAELERLPGIGPKSAQRIAFFLLRSGTDAASALAKASSAIAEGIPGCENCGMIAESGACPVCRDARRDRSIICVVESPLDVVAIERVNEFGGTYHVLNGVLSPLDGVGPDDINLASLLERVRREKPREVILAINSSTEGETTALYIRKMLADSDAEITRLAQGLPTGASIEYADDLTLTRALSGRRGF